MNTGRKFSQLDVSLEYESPFCCSAVVVSLVPGTSTVPGIIPSITRSFVGYDTATS